MVTFDTLIAVAVDGLAFGIFLALLGLGITLVYGLGDVLNLSIGVFSVMAVILTTVMLRKGFGLVVAMGIGLVGMAVLGLVIDRTLLSLVYRSEGEERILLGIFTTLGLAIFIDGVLTNFYTARYTIPANTGVVSVSGASVAESSVLMIVIGLVAIAVLFAFLKGTFIGKATRTVFQDERGAQLVGVNPRKIRTLIFVLSVAVAGLAGLVFAIGSNVSVASGFEFTVFALIVSIVGGVRSLTGAVVAGVFLGVVNGFANFFIGSYIATIILFGTAIVALIVKPESIS